MLRAVTTVLASTLFLAGFAGVQARPAHQDEDDSPTALGKRTFDENCLICHGNEMTSRQRLTTKQWSATVDKMIGWGAPVPPERKADLMTFLDTTYSAKTAKPPMVTISADEIAAEASGLGAVPAHVDTDVANGATLYTKHCATCHGADGQGGDLGPSLIERPILVHDQAYHTIIRSGLRRMPGFTAVLKGNDENDLLAWLRTRRVK